MGGMVSLLLLLLYLTLRLNEKASKLNPLAESRLTSNMTDAPF